MLEVENTTFSGIGKTFSVLYESFNQFKLDWKGRQIFKGEEYYIFDTAGHEVYVHIEEVQEYLEDHRLDVECYDQLIILIEALYDNYPVIM